MIVLNAFGIGSQKNYLQVDFAGWDFPQRLPPPEVRARRPPGSRFAARALPVIRIPVPFHDRTVRLPESFTKGTRLVNRDEIRSQEGMAMSRRGWFGRTHLTLTGLVAGSEAVHWGRSKIAQAAERPAVPVEAVSLHLFDHARWLNAWRPLLGAAGFDFLHGFPTRDVSGVTEIDGRYRPHLLVGSGLRLAEERKEIIKHHLPDMLHLKNGFGKNFLLLTHLFQTFFGAGVSAELPGLVFPMSIYPSSRHTAAKVGVRVEDRGVTPNGDERTDRAIATTDARSHLMRFGWGDEFKSRNTEVDLRDSAFAIPADRIGERFTLSSWRRWRVGYDIATGSKGASVYQEELGYSTPDERDRKLREEAYLPYYGDKVFRDREGRTRYIDLCNLLLIRLFPRGSEMRAESDVLTVSFDRTTGRILDLCSMWSPFDLFYARGAELRAMLSTHLREHHRG